MPNEHSKAVKETFSLCRPQHTHSPVWIVVSDGIDDIAVSFESEEFLSRGCLPHLARPIVTTSNKATKQTTTHQHNCTFHIHIASLQAGVYPENNVKGLNFGEVFHYFGCILCIFKLF